MKSQTFISKTGRVLDDHALDAIAAEAEAGYELDKIPGRRWVGRPALGTAHGQSPRINLRLAPDLYEAVRAKAQRDGRRVSDLAREAVERYMQSRAS